MVDPRRDKRAPASLKVKYRSASVDQFIEQFCADISRGGIFVKTKKPVRAGALLKFEFQLSDTSPVIHGVGRVAWRREAPVGGQPAGMGIKFLKLDADSRVVVERAVAGRGTGPSRFDQTEGAELAPPSSSLPPAPRLSSAPPPQAAGAPTPIPTAAPAALEAAASAPRPAQSSLGPPAALLSQAPGSAPLAVGLSTKSSGPPPGSFFSAQPRAAALSAGDNGQRHSGEFLASAFSTGGAGPQTTAEAQAQADQQAHARDLADTLFGDFEADLAGDGDTPLSGASTLARFSTPAPPPQNKEESIADVIPSLEELSGDPPEFASEHEFAMDREFGEADLEGDRSGAPGFGEMSFPPPASAPLEDLDTEDFQTEPFTRPAPPASGPSAASIRPSNPSIRASTPSMGPAAPSAQPSLAAPEAAANEAGAAGSRSYLLAAILLALAAAGGAGLYFLTQPGAGAGTASPSQANDQAGPAAGQPVPGAFKVNITSAPRGAELFIDGTRRGTTPITLSLPGERKVELKLQSPGYATATRSIVPSVDGSPQRFQLEALPFQLVVRSRPAGAQVTAKGTTVTAPAPLDLGHLSGVVQVGVSKKGYRAMSRKVRLDDFDEVDGVMQAQIEVKLSPLPGTKPPSAALDELDVGPDEPKQRRKVRRVRRRAQQAAAPPAPDEPEAEAAPTAEPDAPTPAAPRTPTEPEAARKEIETSPAPAVKEAETEAPKDEPAAPVVPDAPF